MAGTGSDFAVKSLGGLPAPKVQLAGIESVKTQTVQHSKNTGTYVLWRYPMVSVMDLSPAQIEQGVYVEMLHYRPHKSPGTRDAYTNSREAGYVVPVAQIGGVNPLAGIGSGWTRGGSYNDSADRPNHYKVVGNQQQVPVWEYLHNRHDFMGVNYNNTAGTQSFVNLLCPTANKRYGNYQPGKTFGYAGRYRPYYFCFRYIMFDDKANNWVSGPLSKIVKLTHKVHPFVRDYQASALIGRQANRIDPNFVVTPVTFVNDMACQFETRTPSGSGA